MKNKIKYLLLITVTMTICGLYVYSQRSDTEIRPGSIVFQESKSAQSPLIRFATCSRKTHCGMVVVKNGKQYILEASNVVKLTPIEDWIKKGVDEKYWIRSPKKDLVSRTYEKYLGQKYDLAFKFDNGKMYCSELVYVLYKEEFGIELCKPRKLSSYNLFRLKEKAKDRGMNLNQLVVAPSDLYNSEYF